MNTKTHVYFLLIVIFLKLFAIFYTNFDLFGDEAQYWAWSLSLDYGYYSKPPMLSWIIFGFSFLFGSSFESLKLIPFFAYFFTTFVIYLLSYELYKKKELAIITALSFYLLPSVTVSSFILSTDVFLIFFWTVSLLLLIKIRRNPTKINFVILGFVLGVSFLTKYAAIYFLLCLILFLFIDQKTRNGFCKNFSNIPLFFFALFLILSPNIFWNIQNNWLTLSHTSDNAGLSRANINFYHGVEFLFTQSLMLGPVLILFLMFNLNKIKINFETNLLLCFSIPVFLIVLSESILVRANANWAAVALISFFIFIAQIAYGKSKKVLLVNNLINFLICFIFFTLIALSVPLKIFDRINGISYFAESLKKGVLKESKYLVVEDRLLYSNLLYAYKDYEIKILTPYNPQKKIKSQFQITDPLLSNFNKNFLYIGYPGSIDYLKNKKTIRKIYDKKVVFKKNPIEIYEVLF